MFLSYVQKLTTQVTSNTKFLVFCTNERITDFFKWIGKNNILKYLGRKIPTNTDEENNTILQEIFKESPDVQFGTMTEALQNIADYTRAQVLDNGEKLAHLTNS